MSAYERIENKEFMNAYKRFEAQDNAIKAKVQELMKNSSDYIKRTGKLSNEEWNEEQMKRGEIRYAIASCERKLKTLYEREQTEDVLESIAWYEKARCQYKESEIMMNLGIYKTPEPFDETKEKMELNRRDAMFRQKAYIAGLNKAMAFLNDSYNFRDKNGIDGLKLYKKWYDNKQCTLEWKQCYICGLDDVLSKWIELAKEKAKHQSNGDSVVTTKKHYDAVKNKVESFIMRLRDERR